MSYFTENQIPPSLQPSRGNFSHALHASRYLEENLAPLPSSSSSCSRCRSLFLPHQNVYLPVGLCKKFMRMAKVDVHLLDFRQEDTRWPRGLVPGGPKTLRGRAHPLGWPFLSFSLSSHASNAIGPYPAKTPRSTRPQTEKTVQCKQ